MIGFNCPSCDVRFEVDEQLVGLRKRCTKCGAALTVPERSLPPPLEKAGGGALPNRFCSSCGAALVSDARFCSSCGAQASNQNGLVAMPPQRAAATMTCRVCGNQNGRDRNKCESCQLPIGNLAALRTIQQNVRAEQSRVRNELSKENQRVFDPEEFICYMAPAENGSKIYVVTERRVIAFKRVGWADDRFVRDRVLDFSEIVSMPFGGSDLQFADILSSFVSSTGRLSCVVHTKRADVEFWFRLPSIVSDFLGGSNDEQAEGQRWLFKFRESYQAYMEGSRIIGARLMRADLG